MEIKLPNNVVEDFWGKSWKCFDEFGACAPFIFDFVPDISCEFVDHTRDVAMEDLADELARLLFVCFEC